MASKDPLGQDRTRVPGLTFSTEHFRPHEQFDAWCDFTSSMCELEAIDEPQAGFKASAASHQLGSMLLTSFSLSPMNFRYTQDILRKSSFDHWCISVVTKGEVASESTGRGFKAAAGQTVLHSYAVPFSGQFEATNYSGLFFSRDDFWDIADELDRAAHDSVKGPLSQIVSDFLAALPSRAAQLTIAEGSAINEAFGHLLRAMVKQTPTDMEAAHAPIAATQFERARRFVGDNLKSPTLSPDAICKHLGVSRRQLYYLFERHGGVAQFVRNRRLAGCYNALKNTTRPKLISTVAYEYGFTNLPSFNRQFQARYGFSPSEARAAWLSGEVPNEAAGNETFVDWLLRSEAN